MIFLQHKNKGIVALVWASTDKILTNGIALVISIILARLIEPGEYGVLATASIFIVVLSLFVEPGMTSALIQKKNSDELDFSTIQSFNMVFGVFLYTTLVIFSEPISFWFDMPVLSSVIRILGLQIIVGGFNSVQIAYVQKNMLFKKYLFCSLISVTIAAIVGIAMAYMGGGVWALVAYNLLKQIIITIMTYFMFKCHFGFRFSRQRFCEMVPFASKILFSKFIDQGYVEVTQVIISKKFSSIDLAYYNKGKSFPELVMNSLNNALSSVMFPYFSEMQENMEILKKSMRSSIKMTSYICVPMMIGLCACSESFIVAVLTEKWINSVPFLQLYCLYYIFIPFSNIIQQSLKAIGNSGIVLKIEVFKFIISVISLLILLTCIKSPIAIALSVVFSYAISFFVECIVASKYLYYKANLIVEDIIPSLSVSCIMGMIVFLIGKIKIAVIWKLFIQILIGGIFYLLVTYAMKFPQISFMRSLFNKKNKGV